MNWFNPTNLLEKFEIQMKPHSFNNINQTEYSNSSCFHVYILVFNKPLEVLVISQIQTNFFLKTRKVSSKILVCISFLADQCCPFPMSTIPFRQNRCMIKKNKTRVSNEIILCCITKITLFYTSSRWSTRSDHFNTISLSIVWMQSSTSKWLATIFKICIKISYLKWQIIKHRIGNLKNIWAL